VRVWREGEPPAGAHDALLDNRNGWIERLSPNRYRLRVDISPADGVRNQRGEYLWTVVLVRISPSYDDLGLQVMAAPARLRFEPSAPGTGGGNDYGNNRPIIN